MTKKTPNSQLAFDLKKDTQKIEKAYQSKRRQRKKEKQVQEDLSQQWLAPLLLFITLIVGYLLYFFSQH